ncbi:MAG: SprB repeat-containing protein [Bacteroidia bacterium]
MLSINTAPVNVSCYGFNNGSISATTSGGAGSYTYLWFPGGSTDSTVINLIPATYSVTVTDANGCTTSVSSTITEPAQLTTDAGASQADCEETFCPRCSSGFRLCRIVVNGFQARCHLQ